MAHIGAEADRAGNPDPASLERDILLHDDRVGAFGHRRASEDPRRLARADPRFRRMTGRRPRRDGMEARVGAERGMRQRIAVDRRIGELRHIARRQHIGGDDPAMGLAELHLLRLGDRPEPLGDQRDCGLMAQPVAAMLEAVVGKPPRHRRSSAQAATKSASP